MREKINIRDRKVLYIVLCFIMISVFTLTIAYAALSVTLTIQGSARVTSSDWDIYLGNQKIEESSVADSTLSVDGTEANFNATFNIPGDYYEFTIDIINAGDIDATVTSVNKSSLTQEQAKLFNYTVRYENGSSISANQKLDKGSYLRLLVRVEYRKDINNTDLPNSQLNVDFSFDVEFTQSDGDTGNSVPDNGSATPTLITFNYNYQNFQAEEGMTWEEWINSDYNILGVDAFEIFEDGIITHMETGFYITISSQSDYDSYFDSNYDTSFIAVVKTDTVIEDGEIYYPTA